MNLAAAAARRLLGIELVPVSHAERVISAIGGIVAIYVLILVERTLLGEAGAALIVASMGASAVRSFAVPHGALSQPWAVLVGHTVSAVVGVTCAKFLPDVTLASAVAVGLSIGAMHYLRAIHPPGGATALTAVIGGSQVHALGYEVRADPGAVERAAACRGCRRHQRRLRMAALSGCSREVAQGYGGG